MPSKGQDMLLDLNEIIRNKQPSIAIRGLYFLLQGDDVVYVGQSEDILIRAHSHRKDKKYDGFSYLEFPEGNLNDLEAEYIIKCQPICNLTMPPNEKYKSLPVIRNMTNVNLWAVKRFIVLEGIRPVTHFNAIPYYKISDFLSFIAEHRIG